MLSLNNDRLGFNARGGIRSKTPTFKLYVLLNSGGNCKLPVENEIKEATLVDRMMQLPSAILSFLLVSLLLI